MLGRLIGKLTPKNRMPEGVKQIPRSQLYMICAGECGATLHTPVEIEPGQRPDWMCVRCGARTQLKIPQHNP